MIATRIDDEMDLLPWIMGGVLAACGALALAVGTHHRSAAQSLSASAEPRDAAVAALPPPTAPLPLPMSEPASPPTVAPAAPEKSPPLPTGQVWECTIDGQRTFAGSPCGQGASIRQLNPTNTMEASPILPSAPSYAPMPSYAADYYEDGAPSADNRMIVVAQRNAFYERKRREHPSPPHDHGRVSPKNR
jgi:hypothetical protein